MLNLHSLRSSACFSWEDRIVGGRKQGTSAKSRVLFLKLQRFQTSSMLFVFLVVRLLQFFRPSS